MQNQLAIYPQPAGQLPGQPSIDALSANRQRHPRYPCEGHAEVFVPHGALLFQGRIVDLSLSGCFIESSNLDLERGTRVEVYFVTRQMQVRVAGHIAAVRRKRGAEVAFGSLSARLNRQIGDLVLELSAQAGVEQADPSEVPSV